MNEHLSISQENSLENQIPRIAEVYKLNPELEKIGTQEQYAEYIKTIFPESVIHDILWHGSRSKDKFSTFKDNNEKGIYFTSNPDYADQFGGKYYKEGRNVFNRAEGESGNYAVLLNVANLYESSKPINSELVYNPVTDFNPKDRPEGCDGVKGGDKFNESKGTTYVVFKSEQIHILGSEADLQGFKDFVSK